VVRIQALDHAGAAQSLQPTDMALDIAVVIATWHADITRLGYGPVLARSINAAVGRYRHDVAIRGARPDGRTADLDNGPHPRILGDRLVADDLVLIKQQGNDVLVGRGHELQRHFMEVRGIGLIDVRAIFGIRAVRVQKRIEVVVQLEEWNQEAVVERTGLDGVTMTILDVPLPKITVPLNPGKNITVVAEVIAMNHLLRYATGVDAARDFNDRLIERMREAGVRRSASVEQYLQEDYE